MSVARVRLWTTFHLLAIGEAHLYIMHGWFFCGAMRVLKKLLFAELFKVGECHTLLLGMTARMMHSLLPFLSKLTCVNRSFKEHQPWSDLSAFHRRNIKYKLTLGTTTIRRATLNIMVELLQSSATACACIFVNFFWDSKMGKLAWSLVSNYW